MHEETFLSSWLREVGDGKEERIREVGKEAKEKTGKQRRREEEKEENETVVVKRRCFHSVSTEGFEFFSQDLWDDHCGVSGCVSGTGTSGPVVPVVTEVPVSASSVVTEVCDGFSSGSDWEFLEPQSFSFSKKACSLLDSYAGRDEV